MVSSKQKAAAPKKGAAVKKKGSVKVPDLSKGKYKKTKDGGFIVVSETPKVKGKKDK